MKFRKIALAVATAGVVFGMAATSFAQAGAVTYKKAQTVTWTTEVCGVDYTGWIHEVQQYTLAPTGQLNFHYIANGEARGADGTHLKLNNKELDHILQSVIPNLDLYDGTLQSWVEHNRDVIVEINAQFNERTVKPGNGGKTLQNHWVFQVNHNGTTVNSVTFTGSCN